MSKRKRIRINKKKQERKKGKKSDRPFIIGFGVFMCLIFLWGQFSINEEISESELLTINGKLNSLLKQESSGGTQKTYFWTFLLKNQPVKFSIGGIAKVNFESELFKNTETSQSQITLKVNEKTYEKAIKKSKSKAVGIKYLSSNHRKYFDLKDYNKNRESEMEFSYIFLIVGIGGIIYGLRMKK